MKTKQPRSQKTPAQAMVEFALILPILLLLIYGLLEVGRLLFIYSSVVSAARQAARYGATTGFNASGTALRYQDCAGMRDAAQRVGFIQDFANSDIAIDWDSGEGATPKTQYEPNSPGVFGSNINDYCSPGSSTDTSFQPSTGNNSRIRVEVRTQYSPIVPLVPLEPFEIRSVSARTLLVSVPIVITSAPQGWDPNATPVPPDTATATITLTPTITFTPSATGTGTATATGTGTATGTAINTASPTVSFTPSETPLPTNTPLPPLDFSKSLPSSGSTGQEHPNTHLTWTESVGANSYEVCIDTVNDNACANDNWTNVANNTSYDASTIVGTTYYWHVRALNVTGTTYSNGANTAFWSFTTSASSCFTKADPLSFAGTNLGFSTTIYNKSAFPISISQLVISWYKPDNQQALDHLVLGTTPATTININSKNTPYTASTNVSIPANGSVTLQAYFKYVYVNGSTYTEQIEIIFGTAGCSSLITQ